MFEVFRDTWGVPHVRAAGERDLAFGQGYVTARDRGWQLESDRWRAEGRLAARLGPGGLAWDRFAVRVRLADTARRVLAALAEPERAWLAAYTAGVNAGLAAGGRDVPEMDALATDGAMPGELPPHTPWPDWMPLGVFLTNHVLFGTWPHLLWREHVERTLGPGHALGAILSGADDGAGSGSNAWALAGTRTASGKPLLAGDPHRLLELPGPYQQVRLACDAYDVVGLAFPGVPGVLHFGHARRPDGGTTAEATADGEASVAWGITNAVAHQAELFVETPETLATAITGTETVPVRGAPSVEVSWAETPRGPLVTDRHALRWPVRVDADLGVASWRALQRACCAADVAEAFAGWVEPVNRVLTADSSGAVLSLTAGRVPDRPREERVLPHTVGTRPDAPTWTPPSWRPPAEAVPVDDVAVDANERPDASGRVPDLGLTYAPHRADRIRELLADLSHESPDGQSRIHGDVRDPGAADLLRWLDRVADDDADRGAGRLAARLRSWVADGARMSADSADAALFAAWRDVLTRRVADHPALAAARDLPALPEVLAPWFDVRARAGQVLGALLAAGEPGTPGAGPRLDARAEAVAALRDLAASRTGAVRPPWGAVHPVLPLHALADAPVDPARVPQVPRDRRAPVGGAVDTVSCTGSVPGVSTASRRGAVARWVWDLSDRRHSRWGVPFGASGDPRSEHFADQHPEWARAGTHEIETDWARLRRETWEGAWTTGC
ncbi:penicillin acylase family protein [Isoptericola halotolerans]|uniref:penicillin acylase family protein n=1 Tax=Isoptericola halotolerans TaxID=300560 RepID=UPI00388D205C